MGEYNLTSLPITLSITTAGTYTAGLLLGHKIALSIPVAGASIRVKSINLTGLTPESVTMDFVFFKTNPASTTFTDKTALDIDDNDLSKIAGVSTVSTWATFADNEIGHRDNIDLDIVLGSGNATLYVAAINRTAFSSTATGQYSGEVIIQQL